MREQSVANYISFGAVLRFLQDAKTGWQIQGDSWVGANVERFLNELDALGLVVTDNLARSEGLHAMRDELAEADADAVLNTAQVQRLQTIIGTVRKTLFAEAREKKAFVTSPKRWDVDKLLTDPRTLFGEGVFDLLDEQARFDFAEATKCLAFERSTAAAFHMMRGTEAVLRSFYCHTVKRGRLSRERQMWGPMVDKLKARSNPPPTALTENLDAIRKNYRNPTQHPEAIYDIDRAQDLLGLVIPVVNQMVRLMNAQPSG